MEFNPDQFNGLDSEMKKATNPIFGFGRCLCPGIHFADGTLFAVIATTLVTCDILPGLDENGIEVLPRYAYTSGITVYVQKFPLFFKLLLMTDFVVCFFLKRFPEPFTMRLRSRPAQAVALLANAVTMTDNIEIKIKGKVFILGLGNMNDMISDKSAITKINK